MEGIERMVRDTMSEVFAGRDERERERNFATLPTLPLAATEGNAPAPFQPLVITPAEDPHHILSRWPCVGQDTVALIELGKFDIDNLPKLHRSDELRNAYLKRSIKGVYHPLEGGPAELIIGTTKLQSSFKDPTTFFLAWQIYVSIQTEFCPAFAPGLAYWTERLLYFVQLNYPWPSILEYIIAYYQKFQNRLDNDAWFNPNPTLMAYHFTLVQRKVPLRSLLHHRNKQLGTDHATDRSRNPTIKGQKQLRTKYVSCIIMRPVVYGKIQMGESVLVVTYVLYALHRNTRHRHVLKSL